MSHGKHLKVLGLANPTNLGDPNTVSDFLKTLVSMLGMRILGEPMIHDVAIDISKMGQEPFEDEGGVTGVCVLSTSHCAIHTWPERKFFVLDIYSCRDFDRSVVESFIAETFGAYNLQVTDLSASLVYDSIKAGGLDFIKTNNMIASEALS